MPEIYESIVLNGSDRNVERLGAFVAWVIANDLLEPRLVESAGSATARVRMQDLTGPAFLTTILHGDFKREHVSEAGQAFVEAYFVSGQYDGDYDSCSYEGENEWLRFDEVSPLISRAFREFSKPKSLVKKFSAKILKFPGR